MSHSCSSCSCLNPHLVLTYIIHRPCVCLAWFCSALVFCRLRSGLCSRIRSQPSAPRSATQSNTPRHLPRPTTLRVSLASCVPFLVYARGMRLFRRPQPQATDEKPTALPPAEKPAVSPPAVEPFPRQYKQKINLAISSFFKKLLPDQRIETAMMRVERNSRMVREQTRVRRRWDVAHYISRRAPRLDLPPPRPLVLPGFQGARRAGRVRCGALCIPFPACCVVARQAAPPPACSPSRLPVT